ncbi:MAG TPA: aminotransferase class I/II-fold pyridoxal phosphate-dependent enzyme [Candidatus Baltobacteraceae bacterium]|nr:aminotransferase class I/II-fold pyridoxal phosphate-dependent enzyme [Candidatus Baltobacteraceae bacterium]
MSRFSKNEIISLIGEEPSFDLGGSYGPNLRLEELLDEDMEARIKQIALGYGTAQGDAQLRAAIADVQGVPAHEVVITVGGAHALFLLAFILCERGDEAVLITPAFPPARATLDAVGATVRALALLRAPACAFRKAHGSMTKRASFAWGSAIFHSRTSTPRTTP